MNRTDTPGQSLWTFNGSSRYGALNPGGMFAAGDPSIIVEWKGGSGSDYVINGAYNNHIANIISGTVTVTVTPTIGSSLAGSIDALHIDHDDSGDDFGISLSGSIDIPLGDDDLVSQLGSAIFPVEINNLNVGNFSFINYGGTGSSPFGTLTLSLSVAGAPGPLPLLGCAMAFRASRNLRRTIRASRESAAHPTAADPVIPA